MLPTVYVPQQNERIVVSNRPTLTHCYGHTPKFPLWSSSPTTIDLEKCNIAKTQNKYFKIVFVNILGVLRDEINKSLEEIWENTNE